MPEPGRVLGPGTVILLAFLHLVAFILVMGLGASLAGTGSALFLNIAVASLVAPLGALYAGLARYAPSEPTFAAAGLRAIPGGPRRAAGVLLFASILGVALAFLGAELTARLFALFPMPPLDPADADLLESDVLGPGVGVVVFLCIVVLAPVVEEMLYRGVLQHRLVLSKYGETRPGSWRAALFVAVVYSLVQVNWRYLPAAFVLALALGLAARTGGSTWVSIATHVARAATPIVLAAFVDTPLPDYVVAIDELFLPWQLTASCTAIAALAAFALWRLRVREP